MSKIDITYTCEHCGFKMVNPKLVFPVVACPFCNHIFKITETNKGDNNNETQKNH